MSTASGLVVILILALLGGACVYLAIKRTRIFMLVMGIVAILAALPLGLFLELVMNGCCGAPSTGREGLGYVLGGLTGIAGIFLIIKSNKLKKKTTGQK